MIRIERTFDYALVRKILTHPKVWEAISDDFTPPPEQFCPAEQPAFIYLTAYDDADLLGCFLFVPSSVISYEVHTCLLPHAWGARALEAGRAALGWMWAHTPAEKINTHVPAYNRLALRFALRAGLREQGVDTRSYLKRGILHDQILLGLERPKD